MDYDKDVIYIYGDNFEKGSHSPWVFLGKDQLILIPTDNGDHVIKAVFPPIEAGNYTLTVVTRETRHCKDKQSVKIAHDNEPSCPQPPPCEQCPPGPQGPEGPQGPPGPAGPAGPKGDTGATGPQGPQGEVGPIGPVGPKGDKGDTGEKGDKGADGANGKDGKDGAPGATGPQGPAGKDGAPGAAGPQGPPGISGWKIVQASFKGSPFTGTSYCNSNSSYGYVVTGGGFDAPDGADTIKSSMPYMGLDQTGAQNVGWKVVGKPGDTQGFTVYAICACVDSEATVSPPTITADPSDQPVGADEKATFSVTATGTCLTYQWQKQPQGGSFANIDGATNSSYTTPPSSSKDNVTTFRCVVTNPAGSVTSDDATLIVQ